MRGAALAVLSLLLGCDPGAVAPRGAERHWVPTADGAWVSLRRYPAPGRPPVVLCHGISSNHRFWDLEPGRSLALYLSASGFDVWNLDLRGHGLAERGPDGLPPPAGWTLDQYGAYDLPAAFDYVTRATGADRLGYVGHSMGGIALAGALAEGAVPALGAAVLVGSPLSFADPAAPLAVSLRAAGLAAALPSLPSGAGASLLARTGGAGALLPHLYREDNLAADAARRMLASVVSPLSSGELVQFGRAAEDGELRRARDGAVLRQLLGEVTVPTLFLAGASDAIATPRQVWAFHQAMPAAERGFVLLSRDRGFARDYGHLDLGLGDRAQGEVYPLVARWLWTHQGPLPHPVR
ncbi:MAG: alpha/beta fold hydrolase [Deltaproteobacteria bacterium]|nr:alpha/beta fold hydrolase [Deltaproteobacteria bacterium]